jgi:XTP/dITP diphosphohydrolase
MKPVPVRDRHWTASAIVLHPAEDKVLLIDHVKSGLLLYPGGHLAAAETLAEAAIREVREETGLDVEIVTGPLFQHDAVTTHPVPFLIIEAMAADPVNGPHRHIDANYVCRATTELIGQLDQTEVTGARWVSPVSMRDLNVPPELPAITEAAIAWAALYRTPALADQGTAALLMVTSNPAKAATAAEHLDAYGITVDHITMDLDEIQSADVGQVAMHKARQAYARLRRPVIVEDGGFFIDELGGFPGALAKPVTSTLGLTGLIRLADLTGTRAAHFESALAYADAHEERTFTSVGPSGRIALRPAGHTREGAWSVLWQIWIPPGCDVPVAALDDRQYAGYLAAWRARSVFTKLGDWLRQ